MPRRSLLVSALQFYASLVHLVSKFNFYDITYYSNNPGHWYEYRLQWWRLVLLFTWLFDFAVAQAKISVKTSLESGRAVYGRDVTIRVLAAFNYFLWAILFSDQSGIFCIRRPSQRYRRTVWIIVVCSTVPGLLLRVTNLLNLWVNGTTSVSWRNEAAAHILQLVVGLFSLILLQWMVRKFLLDKEIEGPYEPVLSTSHRTHFSTESPNSSGHENAAIILPPLIPLESTSPIISPTWNSPAHDRLAMAYSIQQFGQRHSLPSPNQFSNAPRMESAVDNNVASSDNTAQHSVPRNPPPNQLRCPTLAKFDYTPHSQSGLHSWGSMRVVRLTIVLLTTFNYIVLIWMLFEAAPFKRVGFAF
jgi:hypothetical protein